MTSEFDMHDITLKSAWDTALYSVPLLVTLFLGFFRLDELISTPRQRTVSRPRLTGNDKNGEPLLSDPDGRPWGS
jgi:hypothetical protein